MATGSEGFTESEALAALAPGRLNEFWHWIEWKMCQYWIKTVRLSDRKNMSIGLNEHVSIELNSYTYTCIELNESKDWIESI